MGIVAEDQKRYFYKIYTPAGVYVKTLLDVSNKQPSFSWTINGGVGELVLTIARGWRDLESCEDIVLYNELKVYCSDKDSSSLQIYDGFLNRITRKKNQQGQEMVECQFIGYISEFSTRILENGAYTAIAYNSEEPSEILQSVIDLYAGKIDYSVSSILATTNTVSLLFNVNTILECLDKILSACPIGWYWYVDRSNVIHLTRTNKEEPDHRLKIGNAINEIEISETMESVRNDVFVIGGTPDGENRKFKRFYNESSQNQFGKRTEVKNDGRLYDDDSMLFVGRYLLGSEYAKEYTFKFRVLDSNYSAKGYDIESIKPGDIIKIDDPRLKHNDTFWDIAEWDVDYWDYNVENPFSDPLIVENIRYNGIDCEIEASRLLRGVGFRLADVKRNLENYLNAKTPITADSTEATTFSYDDNGDLVNN